MNILLGYENLGNVSFSFFSATPNYRKTEMRKLVYHVGTTLDNFISHEENLPFLWV
jgi:hypothetical protein